MALLNSLYSLILPLIFIFSIPIAIMATITTTMAISVLTFRVILIYIELGLSIIPYYLRGIKYSNGLQRADPLPPSVPRRKRRSSSSSNLSATGLLTPVSSENIMGLSQSIGPTRDFEGVGGWRLDNPSDDDALWTKINSRLELPADHVRRHRRSSTLGSMPAEGRLSRSYSPEAMMNTSRARTPPSSAVAVGDGYFPYTPVSPKSAKRTPGSLSSGSSKGSSFLTMKQI